MYCNKDPGIFQCPGLAPVVGDVGFEPTSYPAPKAGGVAAPQISYEYFSLLILVP